MTRLQLHNLEKMDVVEINNGRDKGRICEVLDVFDDFILVMPRDKGTFYSNHAPVEIKYYIALTVC